MRIFHPLLCYYPSQAGGPANTLYWLNKTLISKNYKIEVLSSRFGVNSSVTDKELNEVFQNNHHVQFLNSKGKSFVINGIRILRDSNIIQFSSIFFPPTLPLLFDAIRRKKGIIISPRGELYPSALSIKAFQKKIWLRLFKVTQSKIHFHATNDYEKEIIARYFPKAASVKVIPNFIELPVMIDKKVEVNQILFIGRINPIKNIDVLIRAVALIQNEKPEIQLLIAGDARLDYERKYYKELKLLVEKLGLAKNINFLGHIDKDEKQNLIATSYALILPSKSENFGNVVLEALAQGTPVIASKNTPWQILKENNIGNWIDSTPDKIAEALSQLMILDFESYQNMRERAYKVCLENFEINSNIHHWENYYKSIIN